MPGKFQIYCGAREKGVLMIERMRRAEKRERKARAAAEGR
jgi:hypothetical protein